jgi:predicted oxidoreductase
MPKGLAEQIRLFLPATQAMSKRSQLVERFTVFLAAYSSSEMLACFIMRHPAHVTPILACHHPIRQRSANESVLS